MATYGQVAELAGNKRMSRAVGNALHKNKDPENIPCYRVVNAKGGLSGAFAFGGENEQARRLMADGIEVVDGKVDLGKYTAIWWHFHADNGDNPPLPDDAKAAAEKFKVYYQNGGNLLLTRYATFYIANLGIAKDERVPNNSWGGNEDSPEITSAPWSFMITGS